MMRKEIWLLRSKLGQTLIELTMGLLIMALLMMVIASFGRSIINQARIQRIKINLDSMAKYCEDFFIENGSWPQVQDNNITLENKGRYLLLSQGTITSTAYAKLGQLGYMTYVHHQQ